MHARIDITEVESATKIRAKYLRAMENEEWDLLPGPVYIRSFLKTYADYLGLDSRLLVDEFKRRYERPSDQDRTLAGITRERGQRPKPGDLGRGTGNVSGGAPARTRRRRLPRVGQWLAVGVVVIAIVAAIYAIQSRSKNHAPSGPGAVTPAHSSNHKKTGDKHHSHTAQHKTTTHKPTQPTNATLDLTPTGPVWVCVETNANKILVPAHTYNVGEAIPKASGKVLLVSLGNSSVSAKVNGKSYTVHASPSAVYLKVTPKGVQTTTTGPTCA